MCGLLVALFALAVSLGCVIPASGNDDPSGDSAMLTGAGATFPSLIYQAWFQDYNKLHPAVKVNYQAVGSGAGIRQFVEGTVDFGATDLPMTARELDGVPNVQHIPMVLGAVVVTYNLEGVEAPLRLDGETIARIWLGEISRWDDPALAALNPSLRLPAASIAVVSRSDSSGTSGVFTDYLSAVSPQWKAAIGVSKAPKWPVGQAGSGNAGVTNVVKQTANSIGYIELNYAVSNNLAYADVRNGAGTFVRPTLESTSAAAGVEVPADYRVSIVDAPGSAAYPIASFSYLLVARETESCGDARALARLLQWALHDPDAIETARELHYATLPPSLVERVDKTLSDLRCGQDEAVLR